MSGGAFDYSYIKLRTMSEDIASYFADREVFDSYPPEQFNADKRIGQELCSVLSRLSDVLRSFEYYCSADTSEVFPTTTITALEEIKQSIDRLMEEGLKLNERN